MVATREDHIVPWRSAYRTLDLVGSKDKAFVLGASGHIAGIVNPAAKKRRSHWVSAGRSFPQEPEAWLAGATEVPGSWWTCWSEWLGARAGKRRAAPKKAGNRKYRPIEPAPGRYVKERIN